MLRRVQLVARRRRLSIGAGCLCLLAVVSLVVQVGSLSWAANHFGFALPGAAGLPYRITFFGRQYSNQSTCAGGVQCLTARDDALRPLLPAHAVGSVPTLFGAPHPVLLSDGIDTARYTSTLLIVKRDSNCTLIYTLEGGP